MAKKKGGDNNNNNNNNGAAGGAKKEDGGKKDVGMNVVVLKIDLHCEGCAAKVIKAVRSFDGVESAKVGDGDLTKLTVVGKVDPTKLREKVEAKTKKKAEVISPVAKKDKNEDVEKENNGGGEEKKQKKQQQQQQQEKPNEKKNTTNKKDESKSKELPVTTAVLKVNWHCQGCIQKIHKVVRKSKGYMEMSIDKQKDLVTVKGAIDVKALVEKLKEKLKRPVEIVPPKKEGGGGGDKDKAKSGGEKAKGNGNGGGGGEEKATKGNGGGDGNGNGGGGKVMEGHKMEYGGGQVEYPYEYGYGSGYTMNQVHAPQLFSDENPNACVVM